jgi:hypothetical protein
MEEKFFNRVDFAEKFMRKTKLKLSFENFIYYCNKIIFFELYLFILISIHSSVVTELGDSRRNRNVAG